MKGWCSPGGEPVRFKGRHAIPGRFTRNAGSLDGIVCARRHSKIPGVDFPSQEDSQRSRPRRLVCSTTGGSVERWSCDQWRWRRRCHGPNPRSPTLLKQSSKSLSYPNAASNLGDTRHKEFTNTRENKVARLSPCHCWDPNHLAPDTPWLLAFGARRCRLQRALWSATSSFGWVGSLPSQILMTSWAYYSLSELETKSTSSCAVALNCW